MPTSRVYIPQSTDDALALLEDGTGSVVILVGDGRSRATSACLATLEELAADYDPDRVMFAHVDPRLLPIAGPTDIPRFPRSRDGGPTVLCSRDGEILEATVGRHCCERVRRSVDRLLRDQPGPSLLTRLFRFASGA